MVKNPPTKQETVVLILDQENPLEKEMATHFSSLAWEIPRIENSGRLQYMGLQRDTTEHTHTVEVPHQNIHQLQATELC